MGIVSTHLSVKFSWCIKYTLKLANCLLKRVTSGVKSATLIAEIWDGNPSTNKVVLPYDGTYVIGGGGGNDPVSAMIKTLTWSSGTELFKELRDSTYSHSAMSMAIKVKANSELSFTWKSGQSGQDQQKYWLYYLK